MNLKKVRNILYTLIFLLFLIVSCQQQTNNLLTIEQILETEEIRVPVWYLSSQSKYNNLDVVYRYSGDYSEVTLDTYFTKEDEAGQTIRVARLSAFHLNGQLIAVGESKEGSDVPVNWAMGGDAPLCHIMPEAYRRDKITGPAYQTCMFWIDEESYQFKLYTIWSEEETELFVNSLENMRRPPPKKDKKSR